MKDDIVNRESEKAGALRREAEENAAARLNGEFEAYKRTSNYDGESLESFAARRKAVGSTPQKVGYAAFALALALNAKLAFFAPAEIQKVAADPNGLGTAAAGDAKRPDQAGLNSYGGKCMPLGEFVTGLVFGAP